MMGHFDSYFFHLINGLCGHWFVDSMVSVEENFFLARGALVLAIFTWLWFEGQGARRDTQRGTIVTLVLSSFVAVVMARALADVLPFRSRPMYADAAHFHAPSFHIGSNFESWSSFPSDHAAMFFALGLGVFFLWRVMGALLLAYIAVCICMPRIYLGVHYPSDISVGALIGLACAWLFYLGRNNTLLQRWIISPVLNLERRFPSIFYPLWFAFLFEMALMFWDIRFVAREMAVMFRVAPAKTVLFSACVALVLAGVGLLCSRRLQRVRAGDAP
jgi:membrane-associated phospholipid phosphatase